jgi:hypothetical protein
MTDVSMIRSELTVAVSVFLHKTIAAYDPASGQDPPVLAIKAPFGSGKSDITRNVVAQVVALAQVVASAAKAGKKTIDRCRVMVG